MPKHTFFYCTHNLLQIINTYTNYLEAFSRKNGIVVVARWFELNFERKNIEYFFRFCYPIISITFIQGHGPRDMFQGLLLLMDILLCRNSGQTQNLSSTCYKHWHGDDCTSSLNLDSLKFLGHIALLFSADVCDQPCN